MLSQFLVAAVAATAVAGPIRLRDELPAKIENQYKISFQGVLNNIGPSGNNAVGASAGAIIASPSSESPPYFFTWTRDSALTMKMLIDEFLAGNKDILSYIQDYVKAQAVLQTVSNPSGALASGRGLGEPKYYANLTRFNGDWGRPQRDGPALRATTLITYSNWLLESAGFGEAKEQIWPIIQNDLNYVAQYWNETGSDLWEEVKGSSFFTIAVQHRALLEGIALGKRLGQDTAAYESQAPNLLCFLQSFWNSEGQYAVANINVEYEAFDRKGIDANTVLTSIATFDPEADCQDTTFQPCSSRALLNLKTYVDSFRTVYSINKGSEENSPIATGRYAEDEYYDGNPWYLTTLAVAEQLYDAVQQWSNINELDITNVSLPFWKTVYASAEPGTYNRNAKEFNELLDAVLDYADGFVNVALKYTPASGALAEQFSRENGTPLSAVDLTWSYASFISMRSARLAATSDYPQVPSWGATETYKTPRSCRADSVPGVYRAAVAAGAPADTSTCTVLVDFHVNAKTFYGEDIYLTGDTTELGEWDLDDALKGSANNYTEARPLWSFTVELPTNAKVSYNYLRKQPNGTFLSETKNRTLTVPPCANRIKIGVETVENEWVGPVGTPPKEPEKLV